MTNTTQYRYTQQQIDNILNISISCITHIWFISFDVNYPRSTVLS